RGSVMVTGGQIATDNFDIRPGRAAMRDSLTVKICQIVADIFNIPLHMVTLSSSPDTAESWDSLQHVNLVIALEQSFNVQFPPEEVAEMLSVMRIVELIEQKLAQGKP